LHQIGTILTRQQIAAGAVRKDALGFGVPLEPLLRATQLLDSTIFIEVPCFG
jgi:hypothetical protein